MTTGEQKERKLFSFVDWHESVGPLHWFRLQELVYPPIYRAAPFVLSLLDKRYFGTGEVKGTGFVVGEQGLVLTANHIYMDRVEEWGDIRKVPVMIEGEIVDPHFKLVTQNKKQDYVTLFSNELVGGGLNVAQELGLQEDGPYFWLGYPDRLNGTPEDFPHHEEIAIGIGEKLDKTFNFYSREGIMRQFLRGGAWSGFSGSPVLDKDGKIRAMCVSASISRTEDDYFDVLPIGAVEGITDN